MKTLTMRRRCFQRLPDYQVKRRKDWHAVFSTNEIKDLWPFARWGKTPNEDRLELSDVPVPAILWTIVDEFLKVRPQGGRFFISSEGVYYKEDIFGAPIQYQFLKLKIRN